MSVLISGILIFLGVSLLFYVLFGGADFGAGILELFSTSKRPTEESKTSSHAMAPVWEANHIWLILAVVILFMGFPAIYTDLATFLHIPVIAILMGIVARGCAFTFRHYDTLTREYYRIYTRTFAVSSLWSSMFLGIVAGAMMLGRINPHAPDFYSLYISPWANLFCVATGLFTTALFALLTAVYLVGEASDAELRSSFLFKAKAASVCMVITGGLVFVTAHLEGLELIPMFLQNTISIICFITATILLLPFWKVLGNQQATIRARLLGAAIVSLVLMGWFAVQYPFAIRMNDVGSSGGLTFYEAAAPAATLQALLISLIAGSLVIFPALFYLFKVFKWQTFENER